MHYNYILFKQRYESLNSIIRAKDIFSNKHSPSKYIATKFGIEESIQNICLGIVRIEYTNKMYIMLLCNKVWCWTCEAL